MESIKVGKTARDADGVLWVVVSEPDALGEFRLHEVNGERTATGRVAEIVIAVAS